MRKHIKGNITPEEEQLLISYYNLFELEPDVIALLNKNEQQDLKAQINEGIHKGITGKGKYGKVALLKFSYISVAAALLIGVMVTYVLYKGPTKPDLVRKVATMQISKKLENHLIHLPDGSIAIVMKGSKLTYPASFDGLKTREVYLEGQAYFDVKHNASKAFIVHTGKLRTTVLGTAFNIKALNSDKFIVVTVTRGKVSVGDKHKVFGTITPNQQIIFNKSEANSLLKHVDADNYACWQGQDLLFDDVTMEEAAKLLKARFKIDIICADQKLQSNRFTTTFQHDETLEHILTILCEYNDTIYTYNKDHSVVTIGSKTN